MFSGYPLLRQLRDICYKRLTNPPEPDMVHGAHRRSDEIAQLRQALLPFARIWAINAPLNPDPARSVAQFIAGAWPSMADAKRAYDLVWRHRQGLEAGEPMQTIPSPRARRIGVSGANDHGPHIGCYWLDIAMEDGRSFAVVLTEDAAADLAANIAAQIKIAGMVGPKT